VEVGEDLLEAAAGLPTRASSARVFSGALGRVRGALGRVRRILRGGELPVDQLDPVAVGVGDEADPVLLASARRVGRLLRLDAPIAQPRQQPVEVVDDERQVVVAVAEVVGLVAADVDRQLQPSPPSGRPM
jgi:hypothetical protein